MSRYKAVIYDCDGVMFDSIEANCAFYEKVFNYMGMPLDRGDTEVMRVIHTFANKDVLKHFFPQKELLERAISFAGEIDYLDLIHLMKMEDEFLETLELLKGKFQLAICTNRSSSMDSVLANFHLTNYFSCVMTAAKALFPKPHPDPLLRILAQFNLEPHEAIFIGDSALDSKSALDAGVDFVSYKADHPGIARIDNHKTLLSYLF